MGLEMKVKKRNTYMYYKYIRIGEYRVPIWIYSRLCCASVFNTISFLHAHINRGCTVSLTCILVFPDYGQSPATLP